MESITIDANPYRIAIHPDRVAATWANEPLAVLQRPGNVLTVSPHWCLADEDGRDALEGFLRAVLKSNCLRVQRMGEFTVIVGTPPGWDYGVCLCPPFTLSLSRGVPLPGNSSNSTEH